MWKSEVQEIMKEGSDKEDYLSGTGRYQEYFDWIKSHGQIDGTLNIFVTLNKIFNETGKIDTTPNEIDKEQEEYHTHYYFSDSYENRRDEIIRNVDKHIGSKGKLQRAFGLKKVSFKETDREFFNDAMSAYMLEQINGFLRRKMGTYYHQELRKTRDKIVNNINMELEKMGSIYRLAANNSSVSIIFELNHVDPLDNANIEMAFVEHGYEGNPFSPAKSVIDKIKEMIEACAPSDYIVEMGYDGNRFDLCYEFVNEIATFNKNPIELFRAIDENK
jgi:hypothetical protein